MQKMNLGRKIELPFVCSHCSKLTIVHNPTFYYRDLSKVVRLCNICLDKRLDNNDASDRHIREDFFRKIFPGEDNQIFSSRHLKFWDQQILLKSLKNEDIDGISTNWFPQKGFYVNTNQRIPHANLYTQIFDPNLN